MLTVAGPSGSSSSYRGRATRGANRTSLPLPPVERFASSTAGRLWTGRPAALNVRVSFTGVLASHGNQSPPARADHDVASVGAHTGAGNIGVGNRRACCAVGRPVAIAQHHHRRQAQNPVVVLIFWDPGGPGGCPGNRIIGLEPTSAPDPPPAPDSRASARDPKPIARRGRRCHTAPPTPTDPSSDHRCLISDGEPRHYSPRREHRRPRRTRALTRPRA